MRNNSRLSYRLFFNRNSIRTINVYRFVKRGTHLGLNAIKMLKKISFALLTQVET